MFKTFCSVTFVIYFLRQTNNTVEVEWKLYLSNMISKKGDSQLFLCESACKLAPSWQNDPRLWICPYMQSLGSFHHLGALLWADSHMNPGLVIPLKQQVLWDAQGRLQNVAVHILGYLRPPWCSQLMFHLILLALRILKWGEMFL